MSVGEAAHNIQAKRVKTLHLDPTMFGYRNTQSAVQAMIHSLGDCLIRNRQPEQRLQKALNQFLNHPDIKKTMENMIGVEWSWTKKNLRIIDNLVNNLKELINIHKNQRNETSRLVYQTALHLIAPRKGMFRCFHMSI